MQRREKERLLAPRGDGVFRRQNGSSLNTKTGLAMFPVGSGCVVGQGKRVGLNEIATQTLAIRMEAQQRVPSSQPDIAVEAQH